jgi:CHAD domain-containing protein
MRRRVRDAGGIFAEDWSRRVGTLKRLARTRRGNLPVEDVHRLRVTTRRLRSSLSVLRHSVDRDLADATRRELRALGRALGERRMWDIAIRDARVYGAPVRGLMLRRTRSNVKLRAALARKRVQSLLAGLEEAEKAIPAIKPAQLARWLGSFEREFARRIQHPPRTTETRHRFRIRVKKTRYVIESLGRRSRLLEQLQEHLGKEHDLVVLQSFFGETPAMHRDEMRARLQADRVFARAVRSAITNLRALRRDLQQPLGARKTNTPRTPARRTKRA